MISEALKCNSTLTALNLNGDGKEQKKKKKYKEIKKETGRS